MEFLLPTNDFAIDFDRVLTDALIQQSRLLPLSQRPQFYEMKNEYLTGTTLKVPPAEQEDMARKCAVALYLLAQDYISKLPCNTNVQQVDYVAVRCETKEPTDLKLKLVERHSQQKMQENDFQQHCLTVQPVNRATFNENIHTSQSQSQRADTMAAKWLQRPAPTFCRS